MADAERSYLKTYEKQKPTALQLVFVTVRGNYTSATATFFDVPYCTRTIRSTRAMPTISVMVLAMIPATLQPERFQKNA